MKNEIVLYHAKDLASHIEVRVEDETVWLNRQQLATLFERDVKTIGKHIANVLREELNGLSVVAKFATTATDGKTYQMEYYNLDMIISVGYRVKSHRGIQFRIWANKVLKDYLLKGYSLNNRMNRIEDNVQALSEKVNEIDVQVNSSLAPKQGIFFEGQVFDAYAFTSGLIRGAKKSIILIDNYIDDSVLTLLGKRQKNVSAEIYTKSISKQLQLDLGKHNSQYPKIVSHVFKNAHDRFLVMDKKQLYHFGASLKDLGKKWFAFSRMDSMTGDVLQKLKQDGKDE